MGTIYKSGINYSGGGEGDPIQVATLPTASATEEGKIYQYIGTTDTNYTNGYFYECVEVTPATDPKTYKWQQKNVQDGGSGGTVAFNDITNRPLYNGQPMTSGTVIPYVSNSTVVASNDNTTYTMGGNVIGDTDMELSIDSSDNSVDLRVYDTVSQDVVVSQTLQEKLISGTNIKTVNNQSLLGSGNIDIQGTGGTVDTAMSDTSENAVQNKVIKTYVDTEDAKKADKTYVDTQLANKQNRFILQTTMPTEGDPLAEGMIIGVYNG